MDQDHGGAGVEFGPQRLERRVAEIAAVRVGQDEDAVRVQFVEGMANWLSGWSQDIFTMENEHVRFALNYGLPALVYLFIGHGIAAKIRRG